MGIQRVHDKHDVRVNTSSGLRASVRGRWADVRVGVPSEASEGITLFKGQIFVSLHQIFPCLSQSGSPGDCRERDGGGKEKVRGNR